MKTKFKLGFRNRTVLEQLDICERAVTNVSALPPEKRQNINLPRLQDTVAAARACDNRIAALRAELKSELACRDDLMEQARNEVYFAWTVAAWQTDLTPAGFLGIGLALEKPKRPIGLPAAPEDVRAESTVEGAV